MSDTSLVFNLLGRDNISRVLGVIRGAFTSTGRTAETAMEKSAVSTERLDRQIKETERHLAELNAEFAATGDKNLFGKMARDRSLISQLRRVRTEIKQTNDEAKSGSNTSFLGRLFDQLSEAGGRIGEIASKLGQFGSTAGAVISPVFAVAAALAAVNVALASIGPALSLAGGAIGSLPGVLAGGLAAVGTLKLGLFGLGDEWKRLTTVKAGGASASKAAAAADHQVEQAARAVARAERDVRDAQKQALEAQQAINDAREAASKRLRDEALDLKQARFDQKDAADAVTEAEGNLANAMRTGDPIQIKKAQEALDEARLAAERAKNKVDDLTEANAKNAKTGVEGSDEVVAAKKREADARQRVADAQEAEKEAEERLADARKQQATGGGGGGGAAQQVTKLAPAARAVLNTILGLRPAFAALRLDVQQRLFAGLAAPIRGLAEKWLPQLHTTLGGFASTFNSIGKTAISSLGKTSFIKNLASGADAFRKALGEIGKAAAGPLLDAFGRLARASAPFLEKVGHLIAGVITGFSKWIKQADESGKLTSFFKQASDTLGKVWSIGGKVFGIVGKIIGIIWGQSNKAGNSALDSIDKALSGISVWLDDPKNQKGIRDLFDGFMETGREIKKVGSLVGSVAGVLSGVLGPALTVTGSILKFFTHTAWVLVDVLGVIRTAYRWMAAEGPKAWNAVKVSFTIAYNWVLAKGNALVGWVGKLPGRIGKAAVGMWDGFKNAFRSALNWVIGKWNNLHFTMPSFLGGGTVGMPPVSYLARGGIVPATPGGRLAVLGEGGHDEAVIPLPKRGGMAVAGGGVQEVRIKLDFGDSEMGRAMARAVRTQPAVSAAIKKSLKVTVSA